MSRIYVEIPKAIGDYTMDMGSVAWHQLATSGAALGGSIGTVVPVIGSGIGAGLGAVAGTVGSWFGLGSGRREVKDVTRQVIYEAFASAFPGRVTRTPNGVPVLPDQYVPAEIRAFLTELRAVVLADLTPGSDAHTDMSLALGNLSFNERDRTDSDVVLIFEPTTATAPRTAPTDERLNGAGSPGNGSGTERRESGGSVSPWLLGALAAVGIALLAR